ncbi:MAG: hypothetical protein C3F11_10835 [Methylocystaceae bacterium]|nr:MAG: hypothetical protein C3F11_10835 [Methylocystaceae bacterium]
MGAAAPGAARVVTPVADERSDGPGAAFRLRSAGSAENVKWFHKCIFFDFFFIAMFFRPVVTSDTLEFERLSSHY